MVIGGEAARLASLLLRALIMKDTTQKMETQTTDQGASFK